MASSGSAPERARPPAHALLLRQAAGCCRCLQAVVHISGVAFTLQLCYCYFSRKRQAAVVVEGGQGARSSARAAAISRPQHTRGDWGLSARLGLQTGSKVKAADVCLLRGHMKRASETVLHGRDAWCGVVTYLSVYVCGRLQSQQAVGGRAVVYAMSGQGVRRRHHISVVRQKGAGEGGTRAWVQCGCEGGQRELRRILGAYCMLRAESRRCSAG